MCVRAYPLSDSSDRNNSQSKIVCRTSHAAKPWSRIRHDGEVDSLSYGYCGVRAIAKLLRACSGTVAVLAMLAKCLPRTRARVHAGAAGKPSTDNPTGEGPSRCLDNKGQLLHTAHCGPWTAWTGRNISLHPATINSGRLRKVLLLQQAVLPPPKHQHAGRGSSDATERVSRLYASEGRSRRGGGKRHANTDMNVERPKRKKKEVCVRRSLAELPLHSVLSPHLTLFTTTVTLLHPRTIT